MSESLAFLISDVSRLMRRRFDERAQRIGVTRAQWRTLSMLKRHHGIHQGGLAELLEVEPITACRMIDRLEEAGLVERRRDPSDRRTWRLHLTDKAQPLLAQLRTLADALQDEALGSIGPADRDALAARLETIRRNLTPAEIDDKETAHG
ncbi:MarR family winged helix-turn-helix transcriptional regulator [Sphingomonas japonica]|uniref:DNA-binding MarR family transcriptional regulator n=1 Tax=Sphingomonas japonica TaxID=511662 RepID=A0ABX0U274_9SPHN|nr:MarR family transcriptional regulator [Sphingomonas japonica]NIJ24676.1 DNA-binding MarR family transcriptional regulator [Sphingomonas japonica]